MVTHFTENNIKSGRSQKPHMGCIQYSVQDGGVLFKITSFQTNLTLWKVTKNYIL